ncbi:MAG: hypothetical protein A4E59_00672 [Syntrophorhabdus sp. PtaB.Bin027]|jgi:hypothetical protein|nr:MAG: hypothetical protein A4E59_00672 [Syntrophorhabdus sp. PtaB.Bin027]
MGKLDSLIGRCRCREHAETYNPREHNRARTFYFLPEKHTPDDLLCGACLQNSGKQVHGGLVISEESRKAGIVVFQAFAAFRINPSFLTDLQRIWPKDL